MGLVSGPWFTDLCSGDLFSHWEHKIRVHITTLQDEFPGISEDMYLTENWGQAVEGFEFQAQCVDVILLVVTHR